MPKSSGVQQVQVTITAGQSLSSAAQLFGGSVVGLLFDANWGAAGLAFLAGPDGSTFGVVSNTSGIENTLTGGSLASLYIVLNAASLLSIAWLKIRSGSSASPVVQGSTTVITIFYKIP